MVVKVLVDNPVMKLNKVYDYLVPKELEKDIEIGKRVTVNFGKGKGREIFGVIVKIEDNMQDISKLKEITDIVDSKSYLNMSKLRLAKWIAKMYFCNVYSAIKLFLPSMSHTSLKNGELKGKQANVIYLNDTKENVERKIEEGIIKSSNHILLLKNIMQNDGLYEQDVINNLKISKSIIKTVEKNGYIKIVKEDVQNEDYSKITRTEKLEPTEEQKVAIDGISKNICDNNFNVSLLYGVTGSGKTEVYLQVIENVLNMGKTAIVLVPEISLTYQTKVRFIGRFGDCVSVLHSKMTTLEKETEYKRIIEGKVKIVIGPRSALFVPLENLGLVTIDEEHDSSYISGQAPRYNTKEVATRICFENNATLLLGSATPEVSTMYKALEGKIDLYELTNRPKEYKLPEVKIVNMKEEVLLSGTTLFSNLLKEEIDNNLKNKEQTFIFLNRRGHSTSLVCNDCGSVLKCPKCDAALTFHKKTNLMLCHYCSYAEKLEEKCISCKSTNVALKGLGTEKIESELKALFPSAKIERMDLDTTVKKGRQEEILNKVKAGEIDILVGTQMISKGHDIENVTLVGIVNADGTFSRNDALSTEKAFANLLQVSGRSGRGNKQGRVVVQCYDTDSYVIDAIKENSYDIFYKEEIEYRQMLKFPPFVDILVIELTAKVNEHVVEASKTLYDILQKGEVPYTVFTPKSPFVSKLNNRYRIQIVIKAKIDEKVINTLYEKLKEYDKINKRGVGVSVIKNPPYIS